MQSKQSQDFQQSVLFALLTLAALLSLFIFRPFDDNRLTSWNWVFAEFSAIKFFMMLAAGLFISYPLSRFSLSERMSIFILCLCSFFIATLFWQQPEVIVDASRYFMQAKYLELYGPGYFLTEWGEMIPAWTDMPLVPFIYGVIFRVFGETRIGVQIFTSLIFSATLGLTFLIGKTLWNKQIGLYAAALLMGIPYLFTQVPLLMVDIAAMFFLTLAIYAVIIAVESKNTVYCLSASVAITLALLVKYSNGLMLSITPFIFIAYYRYGWKLLFRQGVIITIGVMILLGILLLVKFDVFIGQLQLLKTYQLPALSGWKESFPSTFMFQIHPVITVAAFYSLYRAINQRDARYLIICWLVVFVVLLNIERIRYLIVIFPMLTLMSAYGFYFLKCSDAVKRFVVTSIVVSSVLIAVFAYLPFLERTSLSNIKLAGEYLDSIAVDIDRVDVYVQNQLSSTVKPSVTVPLLDLFTEQELVYHPSRSALNTPVNIDRLPLRWTWDVDSTSYLSDKQIGESDDKTVVIIQSRADQQLPECINSIIKNHYLRKEFKAVDRAFKFQTTVKIFQRNDL